MNSRLLRGMVQVKMDSEDAVVHEFKVDDIVIIKNTSRSHEPNEDEKVDIQTLKELEKD